MGRLVGFDLEFVRIVLLMRRFLVTDLGGSVPGNGTIPPDSLRTNLLVLARSERCFAQRFPYQRFIVW